MSARDSDRSAPVPPAVDSDTGDASDPLKAYRAKRSPDRTPEPFGTARPGAGRLFVVHKHAARRLHYDLRLEFDGVLLSWAVPKGPSFDQDDKRLAVHVEDHPIEYGDFEGLIPEGNYGAGAVIVWDRGEWVPLEDAREGLEKGKLLFELKGYKLKGRWTLVKIKKSQKDWLLIKERDAFMAKGVELSEASVLSGLTVEDLAARRSPLASLAPELAQAGAVAQTVKVDQLTPMLCEPHDKAFSKPGWVFEPKLDGYRLLAGKAGDRVTLITRNGNDYTKAFPEIAHAVAALPVDRLVLDGEVVVPGPNGLPSFQALQQRGNLQRPIDIRRASVELPATYYGFDLLGFEGYDLRPLPLVERKRFLQRILPPVGALSFLDHFETDGIRVLERAVALGLEGVIAKRADAPYRGGRSPLWLKIKAERTGDFIIVGYTPPKGSRTAFGAIHLADYVDGILTYAGRAGTGLTDRQLKDIKQTLDQSIRPTPPCRGPVPPFSAGPDGPSDEESVTEPEAAPIPDTRGSVWVEPKFVCEAQFREWTEEGLLRHPAFLRLRDDKKPEDCERQGPEWSHVPIPVPSADPPPAPPVAAEPPKVVLTNLKKVFWPEDRYTKGDLVQYYREIAPWLLPYLTNRPVVLTRFPDGIHGKSFYQKDAPEFAPVWFRTVPIWSEDTQREVRYFVCENLPSLLYLANMGSIPLHIWASQVDSLERPDWCVLDLDPKDAPFTDVVKVARTLHELCEAVELPNFVKTTGKTGLHILVPLARQCTYEQSRQLGELLARLVAVELGEIATVTRHVTRRDGKVYIDYLQNRHGQLIVAPFSVRPLPGAPVSMPLLWEEVNEDLEVGRHTIKTALARMEKLERDPVRPVLELVPDLPRVLDRLGRRLAKSSSNRTEEE